MQSHDLPFHQNRWNNRENKKMKDIFRQIILTLIKAMSKSELFLWYFSWMIISAALITVALVSVRSEVPTLIEMDRTKKLKSSKECSLTRTLCEYCSSTMTRSMVLVNEIENKRVRTSGHSAQLWRPTAR